MESDLRKDAIFKCVVGQLSLEYFQLFPWNKSVFRTASRHLEGLPITDRLVRKAARALDVVITQITPLDPHQREQLTSLSDPNVVKVLIRTALGQRAYLISPPLDSSFSRS